MNRRLAFGAALGIMLALMLAGTVSADTGQLPDQFQMQGSPEASGTQFELTNSSYLNITSDSPEPVNLSYDRVILVAWDGVRVEELMNLYNQGRLPVLKYVMNNGSYAYLLITDHITWTDPGFGMILSGYSPAVSGMYGLNGWEILSSGLSIFENLHKRNITTAVVNSRDATLRWTSNDSIVKVNGSKISHGYFEWNFMNAMDSIDYYYDATNFSRDGGWYMNASSGFPQNYSNNDTIYLEDVPSPYVALAASNYLANHTSEKLFMYVHFCDPDSAGHSTNGSSPEYSNAIIRADASTGMIVSKVISLGLYNSTAIVITTDHGFFKNWNNHIGLPYPAGSPETYLTFMQVNKPILSKVKLGYQGDVAPTVYELLGVNYTSISPAFNISRPIWLR